MQQLLTADHATFHDPRARARLLRRRLDLRAHDAQRAVRLRAALPALPRPARRRRDAARGVARLLLGGAAVEARARLQALRHCAPRWTRTRITVPVPKAKKPERERVMAADEVHLMLARIRPWDSRESILAAGAELATARAARRRRTRRPSCTTGAACTRCAGAASTRPSASCARRRALEPRRARHWLALAEVLERDERAERARRARRRRWRELRAAGDVGARARLPGALLLGARPDRRRAAVRASARWRRSAAAGSASRR